MKKLFITNNGAIGFDTESQEAKTVSTDRDSVSRIYLISEPTHVIYEIGETKQEIYAEPDDIIVMFYPGNKDIKNRIVVAKSAQWADNIKAMRDAEQKRKEEWAAKQSECIGCESDCPNGSR